MKKSIFIAMAFLMPLANARFAQAQSAAGPNPSRDPTSAPVPGPSGALDSSELQRASGPVEFISNTARPSQIDSRAQITELGSGPGRAVRGGASTFGARSRYFVIHRTHPEEFDKLDADIFGLGSSSGVDTIANLRLIIQGYLQSAYNYSEADASLLSEYITIYNAVYRRNRTYFTQRYKTPLLEDLTAGNEGLALRYDEWAGQTLMVVPLMTAAPGSLSAIDTTAISDPNVIDKMREDPDKGVDSRQNLVALKEREADAAQQQADSQKRANADEQRKIADEEKRIADEQKRIDAEKSQLDAARAQAVTPEQKAAVDQREDDLKKDEAALAQSKDDVQQREDDLAAKQEEARKAEEFAERKNEEAQRDRSGIAADQRELIAAAPQTAAPAPQGILAIRLSSSKSSPRGTIIKVNPANADTLQSSALNQVAARSLTQVGGKTIVAAQSAGKTRLVEVDPSTLQTIKQGDDDLNTDTQIWVQGTNIYAIMVNGNKNYVGRFDMNLAKQAQSKTAVHPWAALNFQGDKIITQGENGAIILINANTLAE